MNNIIEIKVLNTTPNIYSTKFKTGIGVILDDDILINYLTLNEYLQYVGRFFKVNEYDLKEKIKFLR